MDEWTSAQTCYLAFSIKQVFTSGFRPRMNGATERTHRFLNATHISGHILITFTLAGACLSSHLKKFC